MLLSSMVPTEPLQQPIRSLILIFCAWKALLLFVVYITPGPGYDTGPLVLFRKDGVEPATSTLLYLVNRLCIRVMRWDSLYFLDSIRHGYVWEQNWAFSWAFTRLISILSSVFPWRTITTETLVAVTVSTGNHLLSVIVLYHLVLRLQATWEASFVAACVHIFAPAGIFLSAPYTESSFSLTNFLGMLLYAMSGAGADPGSFTARRRPSLVVAAGIAFGVASMFRSNGLLNGIVFATHILRHLPYLFASKTRLQSFTQCLVGTLGGLANLAGFVIPQIVAYKQFCHGSVDDSEWCHQTIPSVYSYVQTRYWNVGFLHYWELRNIPLFMMAGPMAVLMIVSGFGSLRLRTSPAGDKLPRGQMSPIQQANAASMLSTTGEHDKYRRIFAAPQLVLALLAPTNYHVQIITRLASAYPMPYLWLAERMQEAPQKRGAVSWWAIRYMIIWGLVQGGLFASFLPPA